MKQHRIDESKIYRAVGEIDDRFVSEALFYTPKRVRLKSLLPVLSSVAASLLLLTITIRLLPSILQSPNAPDAPADDLLWSVTEDYSANASLIACLSECSSAVAASDTPPSLQNDTFMILWKDLKTGMYYTVTLDRASVSEIDRLVEYLEAAEKATEVDASDESAPYLLWVSSGKGCATSPFLSDSSGNIFYGTPSDYSPEHLPSESFAAFLESLIRSSLAE